MPKLKREHFERFRQTLDDDPNWRGNNLRKWSEQVGGMGFANLPDRAVTRDELRRLVRRLAEREAVLAIMAWGGANRTHGRRLWRAIQDDDHPLLALVERMPQISRLEAYAEVHELARARKIPGLGVAYYTKLIHFLGRGDGYILDQWTGCSINLLYGPMIALSTYRTRSGVTRWSVTAANTPEAYEAFCRRVEQIGRIVGRPAEEIERRLFSEGRGHGAWRTYVVEQLTV